MTPSPAPACPPQPPQPPTKTSQLIAMMRAGEWDRALSLAATFRMGDPAKLEAVKMAHECRVRPQFYRQLGRDPDAAVAAGIAALRQLYPERGDQ